MQKAWEYPFLAFQEYESTELQSGQAACIVRLSAGCLQSCGACLRALSFPSRNSPISQDAGQGSTSPPRNSSNCGRIDQPDSREESEELHCESPYRSRHTSCASARISGATRNWRSALSLVLSAAAQFGLDAD